MLKVLNQTNILLIPKFFYPKTVTEFRPISLCNVAYKVIARIIVNRLRPLLHNLISENQNAFVSHRLISDNIILAHEVIEFIWKKQKGRKSYFLLISWI